MSTTAVEGGVGGEIASHASYRSNINSFVPDTPYMRVPTCAFRSQGRELRVRNAHIFAASTAMVWEQH